MDAARFAARNHRYRHAGDRSLIERRYFQLCRRCASQAPAIQSPRPDGASSRISTPDYVDWRSDSTVFEQLAVQQDGLVTLSISGEPVSLRVARVTARYFDVFGVQAFLGRTFADDEDQVGKDRVAVLSYALWQSQFGSDPQIVGKTILSNSGPFTVIGVIPSDSAFDRGAAQIWHPLAFTAANMDRNYRWLSGSFGLLKPSVSLDQARSQMTIKTSSAAGHRLQAILLSIFPRSRWCSLRRVSTA
jgi:hypothetical protein